MAAARRCRRRSPWQRRGIRRWRGRYGDLIGAEAFATGHNVQLAPAVDIARAPRGGRTFESFGEDPLLQARMVVPEIQGIQSHAVQATIKHFIANNQEYRRFTIDVRIDERTLHEIYLPPFEAAVREGAVAAAMGSFNRINGTYACEHPRPPDRAPARRARLPRLGHERLRGDVEHGRVGAGRPRPGAAGWTLLG